MRKRYVAAYRHAGAAQPHEHPQTISPARQSHTLKREGRERGLRGERVPLLSLAASLDRIGAGRKRLLAGGEEAGRDDGVRVEHQDGVPFEGASML